MEGIEIKKESHELKQDPDTEERHRMNIFRSKGSSNGNDSEEEGSEEDDDDDVYEVERVVGHKRDPTLGLRYQLKWKGYGDSENTFEPDGSVYCHGLVNEYWERYEATGGKRSDPEGRDPKQPPVKRKASQQSLMPDLDSVLSRSSPKQVSKNVQQESWPSPSNSESSISKVTSKTDRRDESRDSTPSKKQRTAATSSSNSGSNDIDASLWTPPATWDSWDSQVDHVVAVEQQKVGEGSKEYRLLVHILWKDGKRSTIPSNTVHSKSPQKLLEFYESHLLFQDEDVPQ
ncbi:hypothetical protein BGZ76_010980 [Entomortierella beljakovae]|nr:hypothetical protein BGZ76_010980 [Entomortierella beljakovae]